MGAWLNPGTHINAIGADMVGKNEIEPEIFAGSLIISDSKALETGIGKRIQLI